MEKWLKDAVMSVKRLGKTASSKGFSPSLDSVLTENLSSFWDIVESCYECSCNYSDFNAFLMSRIVNEAWGYDTIFSRFSECQQAFAGEFAFLLCRFRDYSRLLSEAGHMPHYQAVEGGVSEQEPLLAPFWYHCKCGSKVKLFFAKKDGSLLGAGNCLGCKEYVELDFGAESSPDVSSIASQISARAISMALVFFRGLMPSCYVGGVGGTGYLMETEYVAKGLEISIPPVAVWRPHDRYLGVGQAEALLELKRICADLGVRKFSEARDFLRSNLAAACKSLGELESLKNNLIEQLKSRPGDEDLKERIKDISMKQTEIKKASDFTVVNHELKVVDNISFVLNAMPSIIDYAINVGLKETSAEWIRHLNEDGSLSSDVRLKSQLSRDLADMDFLNASLL